MKVDTSKVKRGCCHLEERRKPTGLSRALEKLDLRTSTFSTPHIPALALTDEERKAVEAYRLQVEKWRSTAIEYARRNMYR